MKRVVLAVVGVLGTVVAGSALAQTCPAGTTRIKSGTPANPSGQGNNITSFITGSTICAARGGDRWQEYHAAGGALIDWKRGANHPVDPTTEVGRWSASNGNDPTVTHTYGNTSYVWAICLDTGGQTYTLVSPTGGTITGAKIFATQVPCP